MNYTDIEDQIVCALQANASINSNAIVMPLPDRVDALKTPDSFKSVILVAFAEEVPDENQSINAVSHHYTGSISVSIRSLTRRGQHGVYALSELVKSTLIGRKLTENDVQLTLGKHTFASFEESIWEHEIIFNFRSLRVQAVCNPDGTDVTGGCKTFYNPKLNGNVNEKIQICGNCSNCGG